MPKLTKYELNTRGHQLTSRNSVFFKIAVEQSLVNGFEFKDLKPKSIKEFHQFIKQTVGKKLTISEVEEMYLRTKGTPISKELIHGVSRKVIHFGVSSTTFRIHGYYNDDGYFVLTHIDPSHKKHREK